MSKILITLLSNQQDVIKSSHFINSYIKEYPHSEVSVLAYKDFETTLKNTINN